MDQDPESPTKDYRVPTNEEHTALANHHQDGLVPMSQEHLDVVEQVVEENQIGNLSESAIALFGSELDLKRAKHEHINTLAHMPVKDAIPLWLCNLSPETKRNYAYYIADLVKRGIIPEVDGAGSVFTIGHFNYVNHEAAIDYIKRIEDWDEGTRQVRAACYISFTAHLNRTSQGWFRKAEPSTLASNKTFFIVRDKCATRALSLNEWHAFIDALRHINPRDAIIAKTMLQGAKRISEVLSLKLSQIDFEKRMINFRQSKTGGTIREIPITYPETFMVELKEYIGSTRNERADSELVFVTSRGNGVYRTQLNKTFKDASKRAKLPNITPHVLRATWVTFAKEQQVPDSEIMKVTGHTSSKMIYAYDKTNQADNYSRKLNLV